MDKKEINKSIFFITLILTLVFNLIILGLLGYSKRNAIINRITNFTQKKTIITDNQLKSMNNAFIPIFTDTCNNKNGSLFKILIIGNSLSYHSIVKNIGWNYISGMAASSIEKDYVHLLFSNIEDLLQDSKICLRISNLANFERNPSSYEQINIDSLVNFQPDIVIFQLGENVNINVQNMASIFEEKYIELVNCFKKKGNSLIICTTPFFPSLAKNKIIEKVALRTNSYMVDLSHLSLLEEENYAKNEKGYLGDKTAWKASGIGIHPGDLGMLNISKQLFITINAAMSRR